MLLENSSSITKRKFFERCTRIQKWVYYVSKACHNLYKFIKQQPWGNVEQNSPFESKVTNNMEKSYKTDRVFTHFTTDQLLIRVVFSPSWKILKQIGDVDWKKTVEALPLKVLILKNGQLLKHQMPLNIGINKKTAELSNQKENLIKNVSPIISIS